MNRSGGPSLGRLTSWILLLLSIQRADVAYAKPAPGVSAALSLIPGMGQLANGNYEETPFWLLSTVGLASAVRTPAGSYFAFQVWSYNIYDAYRDADPANRMTRQDSSLLDFVSMLNPSSALSPVGTPMVGIAAYQGYQTYRGSNLSGRQFLARMFVGYGEEVLFRGFLFPALSDVFGSRYLGAITSSFLFAVAHFQYGPAQKTGVFLLGNLLCWNYYLSDYRLSKNIFAHGYWDFFISPTTEPFVAEPLIPGMNIGLRLNFPI
jgi:hypothetical protein